ncbi:Tn3 family transposase, partial [Klebsiella pneumoniae]
VAAILKTIGGSETMQAAIYLVHASVHLNRPQEVIAKAFGENFATLRRYTPALLEVLELRAAPAAQGVLAAVQTLREMNADNLRKVPADAPTAFIKPRWKPLVITPEGLDRKFYEICALSELKNALRSGDIWVKGSRQFRDF